MDNKLKELIIEAAITTSLITVVWSLTCSVLIITDPDEPVEITIFGVKPSRFACCLGISSIATTGLIWNLMKSDLT